MSDYKGAGIDPTGLRDVVKTTINPATKEKQQEIINYLAGISGLIPEAYDYIELSYVNSGYGVGEIETVIYKSGGSSGTVISTLNLTYDVANRLVGVTKT